MENLSVCDRCGGLVKRHINQKDMVCIDCGRIYH